MCLHLRALPCRALSQLGRRHELADGDVVAISTVLPERCWTTRAFGAITEIGMWSSSTLAAVALCFGLCVCCLFAGCPLYWKRIALSLLDGLIGALPPSRHRDGKAAHAAAADSWRQRGGYSSPPRTGRGPPPPQSKVVGSPPGIPPPSPISSHALLHYRQGRSAVPPAAAARCAGAEGGSARKNGGSSAGGSPTCAPAQPQGRLSPEQSGQAGLAEGGRAGCAAEGGSAASPRPPAKACQPAAVSPLSMPQTPPGSVRPSRPRVVGIADTRPFPQPAGAPGSGADGRNSGISTFALL